MEGGFEMKPEDKKLSELRKEKIYFKDNESPEGKVLKLEAITIPEIQEWAKAKIGKFEKKIKQLKEMGERDGVQEELKAKIQFIREEILGCEV